MTTRQQNSCSSLPSTSSTSSSSILSECRPTPPIRPKLAMALNTLWKIKLKSLSKGKRMDEKAEIPKEIMENPGGDEEKPNTTDQIHRSPSTEPLIDVVQGSDSTDASGGGYTTAAPQYVTDFGTMDYSLQTQHIHNGNTAAYVYTADAASYPYYQYSGNVHSPGQYMLGGNASPTSNDGDQSGSIQHATRASPATIQWLMENYEPSDGTSLPRCTLYDHYKKHCRELKLDAMNAASFGKLIRNVFQNLRTRRLGTRGNSKYHYYGIRIKPESPLNGIDHSNYIGDGNRQPLKRSATSASSHSRNSSSSPMSNYTPVTTTLQVNVSETDLSSLGTGMVPRVNFDLNNGKLSEELGRLGLQLMHLIKFHEKYGVNCSDVLAAIRSLQFDKVEQIWTQFWQPNEYEEESHCGLTEQQLYSLCTVPQVQQFVYTMDTNFYQVIVDVLVPNVLMSQMTPGLTQSCRQFAKNVPMFLRRAMRDAPEAMQRKKFQAVKLLENCLKRCTQLNHVSQAAKNVLQKQESVAGMFADYVKVDIEQVQEQAGWICGCDSVTVMQIHQAFKENLQKTASMSEWAEWMESIVDQKLQILSNYHDKPINEVLEASRQFILKWCFYSSMIIRDLTVRSATSFGSFHLIRMLTDDYMIYLVESRLAKVLDRPLLSVMTQAKDDAQYYQEVITSSPTTQSVLPSISLEPISLPYAPQHTQLMYEYMVSTEEPIARQVVLSHNGNIMEIQSSNDNELL